MVVLSINFSFENYIVHASMLGPVECVDVDSSYCIQFMSTMYSMQAYAENKKPLNFFMFTAMLPSFIIILISDGYITERI